MNLSSPSVLNNLSYIYDPPEMMNLESGENPTVKTSFWFPTNLFVHTPYSKLHNLRSESHELEMTCLQSEERARSETKWEWPTSDFFASPMSSFLASG